MKLIPFRHKVTHVNEEESITYKLENDFPELLSAYGYYITYTQENQYLFGN